MLRFKITQQPQIEPITIEEAKQHCRVTDDEEALLLVRLTVAAREYAEAVTGRCLAVKTIAAVCDSFPTNGRIDLPVSPAIAITAATYKDEAGATTSFATSIDLDDFAAPSAIALKPGQSWPSASLYPTNPIKIEYTAGETPSDKIKAAILLLVGHWFENREEVVTGQESYSVPFAAEAILQQERHPYT